MYLIIVLVFILILAILKAAWPLILGAAVIFTILCTLASLKNRQEERKKESSIIEAEYTEREVKEEVK